jgi:hypothetical protein
MLLDTTSFSQIFAILPLNGVIYVALQQVCHNGYRAGYHLIKHNNESNRPSRGTR